MVNWATFASKLVPQFRIEHLGLKGNLVQYQSCPRNCKPSGFFHK